MNPPFIAATVDDNLIQAQLKDAKIHKEAARLSGVLIQLFIEEAVDRSLQIAGNLNKKQVDSDDLEGALAQLFMDFL